MALYGFYAFMNPDTSYGTPACCIRYPSSVPFQCDFASRRPSDVISGSEMFISYFFINFCIALSGTIASALIIASQQNDSLRACKSFGDFCLFVTFVVWFAMLVVGSMWRFSFAGQACAGAIYNSRLSWIQTFARRRASLRIFPPGTDRVSVKEQQLKIAEGER